MPDQRIQKTYCLIMDPRIKSEGDVEKRMRRNDEIAISNSYQKLYSLDNKSRITNHKSQLTNHHFVNSTCDLLLTRYAKCPIII